MAAVSLGGDALNADAQTGEEASPVEDSCLAVESNVMAGEKDGIIRMEHRIGGKLLPMDSGAYTHVCSPGGAHSCYCHYHYYYYCYYYCGRCYCYCY